MSASEFGLWLAYHAQEPVDGALIDMWAAQMAALHAGPVVKKSREPWRVADFTRARWRPREPVAAKKRVGIAELRAHVASIRNKG